MMKTKKCIELFNLMKDLVISGLSPEDMINVIKNLKTLRKVVDDFNDLRDAVLVKNRDKKWNTYAKDPSTEEAQEYLRVYNKKCTEALTPEFEKEQDITLLDISDEGKQTIIKDNKLTANKALTLFY